MQVDTGRRRWAMKKAARRSMVVGSLASGSLRVRGLLGPRVRVLTYHRFGNTRYDPFCVAPEDFDAQMRFVAEQGLAVSLDDIAEYVAGRKDLPEGAVLITMDDGVQSVYTHARPILQRYGVPAVAFIVAGAVGTSEPDLPEPFMTWEELANLPSAGIRVGSHGWLHTSYGTMTRDQAHEDGLRSRTELESHLGFPVRSFAYPYGTPAHYGEHSRSALIDAGYDLIFTSLHGAVRPQTDAFAIPRVKVEAGEPLWMFQQMCRGAMDGWAVVDGALSLVQRMRRRAA